MKHNYLMRMIKEAGGGQSRHPEKWDIWEFNDDAVERFAKLIYESAFRDANIAASATIIDAAVLEEREPSVHDKAYSEVELADAYQKGWNDAMLRRIVGAQANFGERNE